MYLSLEFTCPNQKTQRTNYEGVDNKTKLSLKIISKSSHWFDDSNKRITLYICHEKRFAIITSQVPTTRYKITKMSLL